jgi:hypothetical protein
MMQRRCLRKMGQNNHEIALQLSLEETHLNFDIMQSLISEDFTNSVLTLEEAIQTFPVGKESHLFRL